MPALADVLAVIEREWPASGAESWDSVGLVSGHPSATVGRILLAVDATGDTVAEAERVGADALLVHHPLLLRGVTTVAADTPKGDLLSRLIRARCALVTAHTNADVVTDGTSGRLAALLGLVDVRPIVGSVGGDTGLGRVGTLPERTTARGLAERLAAVLPPTRPGLRIAGNPDRPVGRVALCAGAGDSLLEHPAVLDADVYVTSDLRHHPASDARERARLGSGPVLVDVSHWAAESLWLDAAAEVLDAALPDVDVVVSRASTDPWDAVVHAGNRPTGRDTMRNPARKDLG